MDDLSQVVPDGGERPDCSQPVAVDAERPVGNPAGVTQDGYVELVTIAVRTDVGLRLERYPVDPHAQGVQAFVMVAQLREVLDAGQSPEPAQKDEQHRPAVPIRD